MESTEKEEFSMQPKQNKIRHSEYNKKSSPERIAFIKEKYRNGVPKDEVENWINGL